MSIELKLDAIRYKVQDLATARSVCPQHGTCARCLMRGSELADRVPALLEAIDAARTAAAQLLRMEREHTGSGREGHLSETDLRPLAHALGIDTEEKS